MRTIRTLPDPVLRQRAEPVTRFDEALRRLAEEMFETMRAAQGVGLAGPQVGVLKRIFVMEVPLGEGEEGEPPKVLRLAVCNPRLHRLSRRTEVADEGCLSIPGWYGPVRRPWSLVLEYQDLEGRRRRLPLEGFAARVVQHETDHLDGILFIDRLEDPLALRKYGPDGEEAPLDPGEVHPLIHARPLIPTR